MIPRGEVGLIFAQVGLTAGVLTSGLYSSVALMVMATTFVAPPTLRILLAKFRRQRGERDSAMANVVTEAMSDRDERRQRERRTAETALD